MLCEMRRVGWQRDLALSTSRLLCETSGPPAFRWVPGCELRGAPKCGAYAHVPKAARNAAFGTRNAECSVKSGMSARETPLRARSLRNVVSNAAFAELKRRLRHTAFRSLCQKRHVVPRNADWRTRDGNWCVESCMSRHVTPPGTHSPRNPTQTLAEQSWPWPSAPQERPHVAALLF